MAAVHDEAKEAIDLSAAQGGGTGNANETKMDLRYGGQNGAMINMGIGGKGEWTNSSAFISGNVVALVLETPPFTKFYPNGQIMDEYLISLIETHTEEITGLAAGVTLELGDHKMSGAGEVHHEVLDSKRAVSDINHKYIEKPGKPINRTLDTYIRHGIKDPDMKRPLVTTLDAFKSQASDDEKLYTPDMYSMTVLYMELDFGMLNVIEAWVVTNHFPESDGGIEATKNIGTAKAIKEVEVKWPGISQSGPMVRAMAQKLYDAMSVTKTRPEEVPLFIADRAANVKRAAVRNYNTPIGQ